MPGQDEGMMMVLIGIIVMVGIVLGAVLFAYINSNPRYR